MKRSGCCFGVDIGGTKIALSAGYEEAESILISDRVCFTTIQGEPEKNIELILAGLEGFREKHGEPAAIGISCGGPLDVKRGLILDPPNLVGWSAVPIVERVRERFDVPIRLENDADACALAEFHYGAGKDVTNMIFLTFGTGLGAGLILNGMLYRGATNTAGEVGHIRLEKSGPVGYYKEGSFEGFCSGGGIGRLGQLHIREHIENGTATEWARMHGANDSLDAKEIARAAYEGDPIALEVMEVCGRRFGEGLSILIDILNPEMIVVGSIYVRCGDLLAEAMNKAIGREALAINVANCKIVPAQLDEQIGDYASLSVAFGCVRQHAES